MTDFAFTPPVKGKGLTLCTCEWCGEMFRTRETLTRTRRGANGTQNGGKYCCRACQHAARTKNKARGSMWNNPDPYQPGKEDT